MLAHSLYECVQYLFICLKYLWLLCMCIAMETVYLLHRSHIGDTLTQITVNPRRAQNYSRSNVESDPKYTILSFYFRKRLLFLSQFRPSSKTNKQNLLKHTSIYRAPNSKTSLTEIRRNLSSSILRFKWQVIKVQWAFCPHRSPQESK